MPGKMRVKVCGNREILVLGLVCFLVLFCFVFPTFQPFAFLKTTRAEAATSTS